MGLIKMYARPIKYKVNGPGTEETADGFVASPVRYSTISVEDLADHISADSRVERSKVAVITDSLIKQIREMVLNGHKIIIPHLGAFKPKIKSNLAINPESVDAASFTAKVQFMPSVELKRDLQASRIEKTTLPTAPENPTIDVQKEAIVKDFKKAILKNIKENFGSVEVTVVNPAQIGVFSLRDVDGNLIPVMTVKAIVSFTKAGDDEAGQYIMTKVIKARDTNAMGRYYETFNGSGEFNDKSLDMSLAGKWDSNSYIYSDFYKVTEPFSVS